MMTKYHIRAAVRDLLEAAQTNVRYAAWAWDLDDVPAAMRRIEMADKAVADVREILAREEAEPTP